MTESAPSPASEVVVPNTESRPWIPRFRLRTLSFFVLLFGVIGAPIVRTWHRYHQQRAILDEADAYISGDEYPRWSNLFGDDLFDLVDSHFVFDEEALKAIDLLKLCANLKRVNVHGYSVSDISPVTDLPQVTELFVFETSVADLSPLADMKQLELLAVYKSPVADLAPIQELGNLHILSMSATSVSYLAPLAEMVDMRGLNLCRSPVADLAPLTKMTKMRWIELSGTMASDLSPLAGMTRLERLDLSNTPVIDVTHLATIAHLSELHLEGTSVSDISALSGMKHVKIHLLESQRDSVIVPKEMLDQVVWE